MKLPEISDGTKLVTLLLFLAVILMIVACTINIVGPTQGNVLGWCYSDSLKMARDSFPLCPDSTWKSSDTTTTKNPG
jgi:hypothetical protein